MFSGAGRPLKRMTEPDVRWRARAACIGEPPDLFFPDRGSNATQAKAICRRCPVRLACLDYANTNVIHHGIWGGLDPVSRRAIRRQMRRSA
jgi:WhiB family redox-sensing transcriptional regulator